MYARILRRLMKIKRGQLILTNFYQLLKNFFFLTFGCTVEYKDSLSPFSQFLVHFTFLTGFVGVFIKTSKIQSTSNLNCQSVYFEILVCSHSSLAGLSLQGRKEMKILGALWPPAISTKWKPQPKLSASTLPAH